METFVQSKKKSEKIHQPRKPPITMNSLFNKSRFFMTKPLRTLRIHQMMPFPEAK